MTTARRLLQEMTSTNAEKLERLFLANAQVNKNQNRRINSLRNPTGAPKLVIKYGPPASGKSQLNSLIEQVGGDPISSYININVDDAVESTEYFKRRSRIAIQRIVGNRNPSEAVLRNFVNHATGTQMSEMARRLGAVYTTVRTVRNLKNKKISDKMDSLIHKAVDAKKNIIFETTGSNAFPNWLFSYIENEGYKVFIVFPLTPFAVTWNRYKNRPIKSYMSGKGFRFGSTRNQLAQIYRLSYEHFINAFRNTRNPVFRYVNGVYMVPSRANQPAINFNPKSNNNFRRAGNWAPVLRSYINDAVGR